jgi:hypothetical protein
VLASVSWEQKYPLVTVRVLTRVGSDHTLLLLESGEQEHRDNKMNFSFELSWLRKDGFCEMVSTEWGSVALGS